MRCEDVTQALAAPSGTPPAGDLAAHLGSCPRCDEWSRRSDRLDRAWEATRPAGPSAEALDVLWARASAALDAPRPAVIPIETPARRRRWPVVALVAAQAAAVLVAALLLLRRDEAPAPVTVVAVPPPLPAKVTVGVDQHVIVRIADDGYRVEVLDDSAQFAFASMADATPHDVFNALESMAAQ